MISFAPPAVFRLDTHGARGFVVRFPYSELLVRQVKQCPGLAWDNAIRAWVAAGPEVVLDLERYSLQYQATPAAKEREEQFRQQLQAILEAKYRQAPEGMYGFQQIGSEVLALQERGILADSMGLGKSKEALDAAFALKAADVLILAPKTLLWNWLAEIEKWGYLDCWVPFIVPDDKRLLMWQDHQAHNDGGRLVLANYEKVLLEDWPYGQKWDVLILDETQRVKNTRTKTWNRVRRIVDRSRFVWALTGTPLEMRVEELWGIMSLLRPAVFGTFSRFRDQHLLLDFWGNVKGSKNHELLRERVAPWLLRRTKSEVATHLPPKLYNEIWVELSGPERQEYEKIKKQFLLWLKEHGRSANEASVLTQLLRLQQFTSSPRLLEPPEKLSDYREEALPLLTTQSYSPGQDGASLGNSRGSKVETLVELLAEWPGQAVVFTRFAKMALLLMKELKLPEEALIAGLVPAEERVPRIEKFNRGEFGKVLVSTDAGAYGLNIVGADLIVHHDLLWNFARMTQREDRLHRFGQTKPVNVVRLLCQGTIDAGMNKVLARREQLFDDVINKAPQEERQRWSEAQLWRLIDGND